MSKSPVLILDFLDYLRLRPNYPKQQENLGDLMNELSLDDEIGDYSATSDPDLIFAEPKLEATKEQKHSISSGFYPIDEKAGKPAQHKICSDPVKQELYRKHMLLIAECPYLACARVDLKIYDSYLDGDLKNHSSYCPLQSSLYCKSFLHLIYAEYAYSEIELRRQDIEKAFVGHWLDKKTGLVRNYVEIDNILDSNISVIPSDFIIVKNQVDLFCCRIEDITCHRVIFRSEKIFCPDRLVPVGVYQVRLARSDIWLNRIERTLQKFDNSFRKRALFNSSTDIRIGWSIEEPYVSINDTSKHAELDERLSKLNANQRLAITKVLEAKCRPRPYIIYGPPGTGKTSTLIELVVQIYKRRPYMSLLLVGSSNSCTDKLAEDLHATGIITSMKRLSSRYNIERLKSVPDYYTDNLEGFPVRVVVTTNTTAFKLGKKFNFVIVDEAGHASEPETIIPILCCKSEGCLVLAGDPMQLGPVIRNRSADRLGLGRSLLVRLVEDIKEYQRDDNKFDPCYITKLIHSYRCDPRILDISNRLFYNSELVCENRTPPSILKMLNVGKPALFLNVMHGQESQDANSFSKYNQAEITTCINTILHLYNMGFVPKQIGVITPYKSQKEKLISQLRFRLKREACKLYDRFGFTVLLDQAAVKTNELKSLPKASDWLCKIDTVDGFQGGEREIIINCLVRSTDKYKMSANQLKFIDEPRRFNVSISRARWINIVIGNRDTAIICPRWSQFLKTSHLVQVTRFGEPILGRNPNIGRKSQQNIQSGKFVMQDRYSTRAGMSARSNGV